MSTIIYSLSKPSVRFEISLNQALGLGLPSSARVVGFKVSYRVIEALVAFLDFSPKEVQVRYLPIVRPLQYHLDPNTARWVSYLNPEDVLQLMTFKVRGLHGVLSAHMADLCLRFGVQRQLLIPGLDDLKYFSQRVLRELPADYQPALREFLDTDRPDLVLGPQKPTPHTLPYVFPGHQPRAQGNESGTLFLTLSNEAFVIVNEKGTCEMRLLTQTKLPPLAQVVGEPDDAYLLSHDGAVYHYFKAGDYRHKDIEAVEQPVGQLLPLATHQLMLLCLEGPVRQLLYAESALAVLFRDGKMRGFGIGAGFDDNDPDGEVEYYEEDLLLTFDECKVYRMEYEFPEVVMITDRVEDPSKDWMARSFAASNERVQLIPSGEEQY